VSRRIAPDPKDIYNHPYVAAVGDFGRFLLHATQGTLPDQQAVDDFDVNPEARLDHEHFARAYFLCDITTGMAYRLPDPMIPILNHGRVGLTTTASDSMVLELQPLVGTNRATLLCYSTSSGAWASHDVYCIPATTAATQARWRGGDGVINFDDRLIWIDLAFGMFTLDTTLLSMGCPELNYIPLPPEAQIYKHSGHAQRRCIGVSQGKLRFVAFNNDWQNVGLWTLLNLETAHWHLDSEITISELWDEEGFQALGLPQAIPALAFIHPEKCNVVYFLLNSCLFSVNMMTGRFLNGNFFNMSNPPPDYHSSRFIRPWRLTHELFHHGGMRY
jgi:hypothetical protein